ncbi:hypothetical protein CR513_41526, partial [Mucuna pruriens]
MKLEKSTLKALKVQMKEIECLYKNFSCSTDNEISLVSRKFTKMLEKKEKRIKLEECSKDESNYIVYFENKNL